MKRVVSTMLVLAFIITSCQKENADNPGTLLKPLASMPTARHHFGFVECNNLLYAIGGYNADALNKVEVYNPANDSWETKAPMPTARAYLVLATVSNKIYAIGGISGGDLGNITHTNVTEEYDPATNTWTTKAPIPITALPPNYALGNQFITGAAINGKIYVAGGTNSGPEPTYIYDPATDTWSNTGKSIARFSFEPYFSASNSNSLFVTDGNNFLQYQPANNDWRIVQPFLATRKGACFVADDANLYSIGGSDITRDHNNNYQLTMSDEVGVYDLQSSYWSKTASLNTKRHSAAAVIYNGNLYVAGGAVTQITQTSFTVVPLANMEALELK